jgi:cytochrome c553
VTAAASARPVRRRWHHRPLAAGLLGLACALRSFAAGTDAQRQMAAPCEACHGAEGRSTAPDTPSLAGQPKQFITTQLVMFREGNRKNALMNAIAAPLSNAEINELGSYFAAQPRAPAGKPLAPTRGGRARPGREAQLHAVPRRRAAGPAAHPAPRRAAGRVPAHQLLGFKAGTRFDMDGNMTAPRRR